MDKNYRAELVGVLGDPVDTNPSGIMMEAAFDACDLFYRYLIIRVAKEDLAGAMQGLRAFNMKGANFTMPLKVEVLPYLDELSHAAGIIGAVNTVVRKGDKLYGENTDGKGFMTALQKDAHFDPKGKKAVLLGAGGAARAIAVELALAGLKELVIVNRNEDRGTSLQQVVNQNTDCSASFVRWDHDYAIPADTHLVINGTSIGFAPDPTAKPPLDYATISPSMTVCDVVCYATTPFLEEAKQRGATAIDGLGMIVYQGTIGFEMWTGVDAPVEAMRAAIAKEFCAD